MISSIVRDRKFALVAPSGRCLQLCRKSVEGARDLGRQRHSCLQRQGAFHAALLRVELLKEDTLKIYPVSRTDRALCASSRDRHRVAPPAQFQPFKIKDLLSPSSKSTGCSNISIHS
jgi:hypothetical protein